MTRTRASAKKAGSSFERLIADALADHIDDRIDRRVRTCNQCQAPIFDTPGRGGVQPSRRFCSIACKQRARENAKRPIDVRCERCGQSRSLRNPKLARSMCRKCAQKLATASAATAATTSTSAKFEKYVNRTPTCWIWDGYRYSNGYAAITHQGKQVLAHRWSYQRFVGPIPEGLTIDHLCRNRACVNPDHLEPVTSAENTRRSREAQGGQHVS